MKKLMSTTMVSSTRRGETKMKKLIDDISGYTFTYRAGIPHRHQAVASAVRYDWSRPKLIEAQAKAIFHMMVGVEVQPMILEN